MDTNANVLLGACWPGHKTSSIRRVFQSIKGTTRRWDCVYGPSDPQT
jgi:hypothetical protein